MCLGLMQVVQGSSQKVLTELRQKFCAFTLGMGTLYDLYFSVGELGGSIFSLFRRFGFMISEASMLGLLFSGCMKGETAADLNRSISAYPKSGVLNLVWESI